MEFEERKHEERQNVNEERKREYYKGGSGGGPSGFFSIKTNVYSKQCYSDPENPGKMICKETKNSSGFDPFNKENNFKRSKENVYTQDNSGFFSGINNHQQNQFNSFTGGENKIEEEPSLFKKM